MVLMDEKIGIKRRIRFKRSKKRLKKEKSTIMKYKDAIKIKLRKQIFYSYMKKETKH